MTRYSCESCTITLKKTPAVVTHGISSPYLFPAAFLSRLRMSVPAIVGLDFDEIKLEVMAQVGQLLSDGGDYSGWLVDVPPHPLKILKFRRTDKKKWP